MPCVLHTYCLAVQIIVDKITQAMQFFLWWKWVRWSTRREERCFDLHNDVFSFFSYVLFNFQIAIGVHTHQGERTRKRRRWPVPKWCKFDACCCCLQRPKVINWMRSSKNPTDDTTACGFFHNVQISSPIVDIILLFVLALPHTCISLFSLWHRITRSTSMIESEWNPKQNAIIVSSSHQSSPECMPDGPETREDFALSLSSQSCHNISITSRSSSLHFLIATLSYASYSRCCCCRVWSSSWGARGTELYVKCDSNPRGEFSIF